MLAPDHLVCHRCGRPIDKALRWPDLMSKSVDHIVDLAAGGEPLDPANLAPAHLSCNARAGALGKARRARARARLARSSAWVHDAEP